MSDTTCSTCGSSKPEVNCGKVVEGYDYMMPCDDPFHHATPTITDEAVREALERIKWLRGFGKTRGFGSRFEEFSTDTLDDIADEMEAAIKQLTQERDEARATLKQRDAVVEAALTEACLSIKEERDANGCDSCGCPLYRHPEYDIPECSSGCSKGLEYAFYGEDDERRKFDTACLASMRQAFMDSALDALGKEEARANFPLVRTAVRCYTLTDPKLPRRVEFGDGSTEEDFPRTT